MTRRLLTAAKRSALAAACFLSALACGEAAGEAPDDVEPTKAAAVIDAAVPSSTGPDGAALYEQHCAGCHGLKGDGDGPVATERPPRAFSKGGFAFGNGAEQLFKTISKGMPGRSDMQPFEDKLNEDERRAVVRHLLTLVPTDEIDYGAGSELRVEKLAVVVRGKLPRAKKDAPEWPRGLVIGLPGGLSLEYRADDVRLISLRTGGFVKREDWSDRGGAALRVQGKVAELMGDGDPAPTYFAGEVPLNCRLLATGIEGDSATLRYEVRRDGTALGRVVETLSSPEPNVVERRIELQTGTGFEWRGAPSPSSAVRQIQPGGDDVADSGGGYDLVRGPIVIRMTVPESAR